MKNNVNRQCEPEEYLFTFAQTETGKRVLAELMGLYYNTEVFDKDPYTTAYNAGRRSVVAYIIARISVAKMPEGMDEIVLEE